MKGGIRRIIPGLLAALHLATPQVVPEVEAGGGAYHEGGSRGGGHRGGRTSFNERSTAAGRRLIIKRMARESRKRNRARGKYGV